MDTEKQEYAYVPEKAWWILRRRFQQAFPNGGVTQSYLGGVLQVNDDSARKTHKALRDMGLIDDDSKPTDLANRWRDDAEYPKVCEEIRGHLYHQELLDLFPQPGDNATELRGWFSKKYRLGASAAGKMANFYELLLRADPTEQNSITATKPKSVTTQTAKVPTARKRPVGSPHQPPNPAATNGHSNGNGGSEQVPPLEPPIQERLRNSPSLHIDIQIHISPEASLEQIDKMFESMGKHLNLSK